MKTMYKILSLSFLLMLGLSACSKDKAVEEVYQGATELSSVELVTDFDSSESRSVHAITRDDYYRLNAKLQMTEKDLSVRVGIRQGTGTPVYHTVVFKKVKGKNQARFFGKLNIPSGGTGNYQISAVVLNEIGEGGHVYATLSGNTVKTVANTSLVALVNGKVDSKIPYILKWTELTWQNPPVGGKRYLGANVRFKPSGSLIAFRVDNYRGNKNEVITKIKVKSNAFVTNWEYNLANLTGGNLREGQVTTASTDAVYKLPQAVTIPKGEVSDTYFYLTTMPVKATTNLATDITLVTNENKEIKIKTNSKALAFGTVPATLPITGAKIPAPIENSCFKSKKLPLEFVAHYNIGKDNQTFDKTLANNGSAHYTHADAKKRFGSGITIEGNRYYLPTQQQMRAVLPISTIYLISGSEYKDINESIAADKEVYATTADYRVETTTNGELPRKLYALRLKHTNFCMQTAYRYEFVGTYQEGSLNSYMKITCRYLGNDADWTLDDISNEDFWNKNTENDVVRYLPAAGGRENQIKFGMNGSYWTSSPAPQGQYGYAGDAGFQYVPTDYKPGTPFFAPKHYEMFGEHSTDTYLFPVRLFSETVVTPMSIPAPPAR